VRARLRRWFLDAEAPTIAVEVRPRSLGVVRLAREKDHLVLAAAASLALPAGALKLSMTESNIVDEVAFRQTLGAALARAGVAGGAHVALVLPDPVARISLLPAAEVPPGRVAEVEAVIRFRLKKSLPFEVREARIAFRREPGQTAPVLAVAALAAVLDPYESACRSLGLEPGLVELAGLALFDALEASRPPADRILVNWDDEYVSILLARGGTPALVRTLTGAAADAPEQVLREVESTIVYYRERLSGPGLASAAVRSASFPPADAASLLAGPLGMRVEVVDPWGPKLRAAAVAPAQELAGAAASLIGRVA
jgi:Tfp pilus assembly PilM family ATPase